MKLVEIVRNAGNTKQVAIYRDSARLVLSLWTAETDAFEVVEELPYEGRADRDAAMAMARGAAASRVAK